MQSNITKAESFESLSVQASGRGLQVFIVAVIEHSFPFFKFSKEKVFEILTGSFQKIILCIVLLQCEIVEKENASPLMPSQL